MKEIGKGVLLEWGMRRGPGGGIPYETDGDARRLA